MLRGLGDMKVLLVIATLLSQILTVEFVLAASITGAVRFIDTPPNLGPVKVS